MAKWTPCSSRPGMGRSRGMREPIVRTTASKSCSSCSPRRSSPTDDAHAERHALGAHLRDAGIEDALLHLEVGDAVAQQAAEAIVALEDHDVVPGARELLSGRETRGPRADDRDALARALVRGLGLERARARTWSAMVRSMVLMVTGSSRMLRTHDASHGAGHTRPVTSGKLFVSSRRRAASSRRPLSTRSFHSGMRFPSGQPW